MKDEITRVNLHFPQLHSKMLRELQDKIGLKRAEIVRRAIEYYYECKVTKKG